MGCAVGYGLYCGLYSGLQTVGYGLWAVQRVTDCTVGYGLYIGLRALHWAKGCTVDYGLHNLQIAILQNL